MRILVVMDDKKRIEELVLLLNQASDAYYGSQDEMLRAMNRIHEDINSGKVTGPITKELFEDYLDTKGLPMPDLLIRTSGEQRLSNFLLWQLAYSEFYFADVHWPDFSKEELIKAIEAYNLRERRYGKV